jgi:nitrate reductase gamma subunit
VRDLRRWCAWLAGLWAGALWSIALIAAPAAFATLARADAGRLFGRIFAQEATASLLIGVVLLLLERRRARSAAGPAFGNDAILLLAALFCTVAGYFALQPMMEQARSGQGSWSFATLHMVSAVFYGAKMLAASALAWRLAAVTPPRSS